jgi:hypothetical protein
MHTPNPSHPKAGLQTIFSSPPPLSVFYTLLCGSRVEKVGLLQQPASSHAQKKESPSLLPLPSPSGSRPARHLLPQRRHECTESEEEARHDAYGDGETAVMRWKSRVGRSSFVEDAPKRENTAICTLVREGACFAQSIAWVAGCQNSVKLYVFCTYGG